jgi:muramidase (phage lysozyme)
MNLAAFLSVIRSSEGTAKFPDPYAVTFGERLTLTDFSDHPHALGWRGYQWKGKWMTAAGAYQINYPTWLDIKAGAGLADFTPASQDAAAAWLIENRAHAMAAVEAGNFEQAVTLCAPIWASLPGSTSGQPQALLADLMDIYAAQGGSFA